jgi:DNA-binding NarL/FixJ family response regulator
METAAAKKETLGERVATLYTALRAGDASARSKIIEECVPPKGGLVIQAVNQYLQTYPEREYLRDDMVSEGNLALAIAAEALNTGEEKDNPKAYLDAAIDAAICQLFDKEQTMSVPFSTLRYWRKRGDDGYRYPTREELDDVDLPAPDTRDVDEALDSACHDQTDRDIVRLRREGFTDQEIGDQKGIARNTIRVRRRAIANRFDAKSNGQDRPAKPPKKRTRRNKQAAAPIVAEQKPVGACPAAEPAKCHDVTLGCQARRRQRRRPAHRKRAASLAEASSAPRE